MANMMNWRIVTAAQYAAGTKIDTDLYFLSDTKEIYRGSTPFTESIILYTDDPVVKALNKLYINSSTLEGKIWNGSSWEVVIKALTSTIEASGTSPVTGAAVASYVAAQLTTFSGSVINSLSWDKVTHILRSTKGDSTTSDITLNGVGVSLSATASDGKTHISLKDVDGNAIGTVIDLDLERFVSGAEYNSTAHTIILYFDGKTGDASTDKITIPVGDLVDVYTVSNTSSINMAKDASNNITAAVNISSASGNIIQLKADGLYAANLSNVMSLVPSAVADNIATFNANGQVVDSGLAGSLVHETKLFVGTSIEAAVASAVPQQGDICIVKVQIGTSDKYQYTGYMYDASVWKALDGNYDAENVYFANDLTTTSAVGNIALTNGQATIAAAGKNLKQVFDTIFVQEKNPSTVQPSVSVSAPNNKAYEVGTSVSPTYTASLNAGSYTYGPSTGVTALTWAISDTKSHSATVNTGSFDAFTVGDGENYTITAVATYGDGAIPVTNVGNNYANGQIKAGSKSATSSAVTGYRKGFYGTLTSKTGTINSDLVRGLAGKTTAAPAAGNSWSLSVPVGALRVVFAYPASIRDVNSVLDVNGLGAEIKSAFTKYTVDVEGANAYTAMSYKVYVLDYASANDTANTYTVKL